MALFDFEEAEREAARNRRRFEEGDTVRGLLDHRWVGMALLLFVVGALFRNIALVTLTAFMLVVVAAAWAWSRSAMQSVRYIRRFQHRRVFPGEEIEAQIIVENHKLLPLGWLRTEDEWPFACGPVDESRLHEAPTPDLGYLTNTYTLRWYQRVRRRMTILARKRGIYQIGPAYGQTGDPFSLFERGRALQHPDYLVVYPEVKTLPEIGLPMKDPLGDLTTRQRLFEDPNRIMGVRDHRPEDDLRHVHWKATARAGDLQTRVYEPTRSVSVVYCLNVATYEQHWHGFWPEMLEYLVSTTASLAYWGAEQNYAVGIVANGALAHADQPFRVLPGRNRNQLARILETLAGVSYIVTADFGSFLMEESPKLPWGATLVLVTSFLSDGIEGAIIRLRDSGRRVVLVMLGLDEPHFIPGVLIHHLPIDSIPPAIDDSLDQHDAAAARDKFLQDRARQAARS